MAHGVVGEIGKNDQDVILGDPHRCIEVAVATDIERGEGRSEARDHNRQLGGAERDPDFPHGRNRAGGPRSFQPVGVRNDVVEKLAPVRIVHVGRIDVLAQQFRRALDRCERRFQLLRNMGGEGRDKARSAYSAGTRHVQKALRQQGEFAGAVMFVAGAARRGRLYRRRDRCAPPARASGR